MRKKIVITVLALLVFALPALAATTDFVANGNITVSSVTLGGTTADLLIMDTSSSESWDFSSGTFTVTNPDSIFRVGSADSAVKSIYVSLSGANVKCAVNSSAGTSYVSLPTGAGVYTVTPSTSNANAATSDCCAAVEQAATYVAFPTCGPATCNAGYRVNSGACTLIGGGGVSGGGGGGSAVATIGLVSTPTTATGQVTATAAGGGKTTLTTSDNAVATVQLPINAVSSDTVITIAPIAKTASAVASEVAAVPATMLMVGNSIYSFSAMSGTTNVTTFNQNITLTFTYTDAQIAGLNESSLTIYYWNTATSAWTALATTINAAMNTLTATTNHFTDFAILGSQGQDIAEGALIRAIGDIDVYIVKYVGSKQFKRLILSPSVFNSYQHLKWSDVLDIDKSVVDSFTTSELVRAVNDTKVYKLYPAGDTGEKRWVETAAGFNRMSFDWDAIYEINSVDRNSYVTGVAIK